MYEGGVLLAFLLWAYNTLALVVMLNSQLARNLRRIGMAISWTTLQPRQMTAADKRRTALTATGKFALIAFSGLLFIVFSWITVALQAGVIAYRWQKAIGRPQAVREFSWKLKNLDMNFDQLAKEMYTMQAAMGLDQPAFDDFKRSLWEVASSS